MTLRRVTSLELREQWIVADSPQYFGKVEEPFPSAIEYTWG